MNIDCSSRAFAFTLVLVLLFLAGHASGQDEKKELKIHDTPLEDVFRLLAKKAGINLVVTEKIDKTVTLEFEGDIDPLKLMEELAKTYGYELVKEGEIYKIRQKSKSIEAKILFEKKMRRSFQLTRIPVSEVKDKILGLLSQEGRIEIDEKINGFYVEDFEDNINKIDDYVKFLNISREGSAPLFMQNRTFRFVRMDAKKLQEKMPSLISGSGKYILDPDKRFLMVTDFPENLRRLERFLSLADREEPQIYIQCHFIEVNLKETGDSGAGLAYTGNIGNFTTGEGFNLLPPNLADDKATYDLFKSKNPSDIVKLNYKTGNHDLTSAFSAMVARSNIRVLSSPNILCHNNEKAKIDITTKVPYIQALTSTQSGENTTTQQQVEFEEVGITLDVTPDVFPDRHIKLKLVPEVSEVMEYFQEVPVVKKKRVESIVVVKDGQTIVLGGLMEDHIRKTRNKVPFLGDIPLLGLLFSNTKEEMVKTELLIFLHIFIVDSKGLDLAKEQAWEHQKKRHSEFDVEFEFFPHLPEKIDVDDIHHLTPSKKTWQFEFDPHETKR